MSSLTLAGHSVLAWNRQLKQHIGVGPWDNGYEDNRIFNNGPSFAYSLPVHPVHTRRDRVASLPPLVWRGHTKSTATRSGPGPDLAMWLESRRLAD